MNNSEIVPLVSLVIGSLGATLGLVNTWNLLDRQRVKLSVIPAQSFLLPAGDPAVTIDVVNMSAFPVVLSEIGFQIPGDKKAITPGPLLNGKPLPCRLEPRESVTAYFYLSGLDTRILCQAFARTSCGEVVYGDSPALAQLRSGESPMLRSKAFS